MILAFDISAQISIHNEKFSHHVTNVRQQLTVIGHQRSLPFPCPLPNRIFLFSAKIKQLWQVLQKYALIFICCSLI